jgi:hypothetical protein
MSKVHDGVGAYELWEMIATNPDVDGKHGSPLGFTEEYGTIANAVAEIPITVFEQIMIYF